MTEQRGRTTAELHDSRRPTLPVTQLQAVSRRRPHLLGVSDARSWLVGDPDVFAEPQGQVLSGGRWPEGPLLPADGLSFPEAPHAGVDTSSHREGDVASRLSASSPKALVRLAGCAAWAGEVRDSVGVAASPGNFSSHNFVTFGPLRWPTSPRYSTCKWLFKGITYFWGVKV